MLKSNNTQSKIKPPEEGKCLVCRFSTSISGCRCPEVLDGYWCSGSYQWRFWEPKKDNLSNTL